MAVRCWSHRYGQRLIELVSTAHDCNAVVPYQSLVAKFGEGKKLMTIQLPIDPANTITLSRDEIEIKIGEGNLKSSKWLKIAKWALVAYTAPHSLSAVGYDLAHIGDHVSTIWGTVSFIFALIGVLVLEMVFIYSANHFTEGWIVDDKQRMAAYVTLGLTTFFLCGNSIVSHIAHTMAVRPPAMVIYSGIVLPIAFIISIVAGVVLRSQSPIVKAFAAASRHVLNMENDKRIAEQARENAKQAVELERIHAAQARQTEEANKVRIESQIEIDQMMFEAEQKRESLEHTKRINGKLQQEKASQLDATMDDEAFKALLAAIVSKEVEAGLVAQLGDEAQAKSIMASAKRATKK